MRARPPPRTPDIRQLEPLEGGAACLGIVLAFHGRWIPLEELRLACGVNRHGSKASNILKAARAFGMAAKGFGKPAEGIMDLPQPSIIQWNFNQFVVLEGISGDRAWLNDPAAGRRSCDLQELADRFSGVVLAMQPGAGFVRSGRRPRVFTPLLGLLRGSRSALALIAVLSVLLVLPGILLPGIAALFIDKVIVEELASWVGPLCIALLVAAAFQATVLWLQQRYLLRLEAKLAAALSARVVARVLAMPMSFIGQRPAAELAGRVASADAVAAALSDRVAGTAFNMIPLLAYALAMAAYDPIVAAGALLLPVLNVLILQRTGRRLRQLSQIVAQDLGRLASVTASTIIGIETVKITGGETAAFARLAGHQARAARADRPIGATGAVVAVGPAFLQAAGAALILVWGGYRVIEGALSIGSVVALQMLFINFNAPLVRLVELRDRLQQARGDLLRVGSLLDQPATPAQSLATSGDGSGRLELRDVTFGYSRTDAPVVDGISLILEAGQRVAVVGASGSGKSTLGRLIAGLLVPWSGEILYDGRPLHAIAAAERASLLAYVDQDVFLFSASIRDNLTLWDPTIPDALLVEALRDAGMEAAVAARPGGLDSTIAEAGGNFSGGQRQRLELARAFVGDPAVLVLDEATAALDTVSEAGLDAAIRRRGCGAVIIAHRLSTIRESDEILVLDQGRVVERGMHVGLLAAGGPYAALLDAAA